MIRHHQDNKIHTALAKSNALNEDGTLNPNINLTGNDADQIYSSLDYMTESFDKERLQQLNKYVSLSGSTALVGERRTDKETIMNAFGLSEYIVQNRGYINNIPNINRYTNDYDDTIIKLEEYTDLAIINYNYGHNDNTNISIKNNGTSSNITINSNIYKIAFDSIINQYETSENYRDG